VRFKLRRVGVEFRIDFLLDEICIVLSRVPILDDVFHCRVPALDVVLRLDKHHRVPGTRWWTIFTGIRRYGTGRSGRTE